MVKTTEKEKKNGSIPEPLPVAFAFLGSSFRSTLLHNLLVAFPFLSSVAIAAPAAAAD